MLLLISYNADLFAIWSKFMSTSFEVTLLILILKLPLTTGNMYSNNINYYIINLL